jgi:hypothetical protein
MGNPVQNPGYLGGPSNNNENDQLNQLENSGAYGNQVPSPTPSPDPTPSQDPTPSPSPDASASDSSDSGSDSGDGGDTGD